MGEQLLNKTIKILLLVFLSALILYHGRPFLVPLAFAALLAMLLLPLSEKLESWGVNKAISKVLSILVIVLFFAGIIALLAWQVSDMSQNAPEIEKSINAKVQQVREYITNTLGIPQQKQQEILQKQQQSSGSKLSATISGAFASVGTLLTNFLLILVYIFLFMYFRAHLKKFVLKLVPPQETANANRIMQNSRKVAQKYITGMMLMIVGLWIMYSIGFAIAGVKNFFFSNQKSKRLQRFYMITYNLDDAHDWYSEDHTRDAPEELTQDDADDGKYRMNAHLTAHNNGFKYIGLNELDQCIGDENAQHHVHAATLSQCDYHGQHVPN